MEHRSFKPLLTPIMQAVVQAGKNAESLHLSHATILAISERSRNGWDGRDFHGVRVICDDTLEFGTWQLVCSLGNH